MAIHPPDETELVEDSEPEREQWRRLQREERKQRKKRECEKVQTFEKVSKTNGSAGEQIINISDDDSDHNSASAKPLSKALSNASIEFELDGEHDVVVATAPYSSRSLLQKDMSERQSTISVSSDSEGVEDGPRLKLGHFAYADAVVVPKAGPSRTPSILTADSLSDTAPKKKPRRATSHRFADDFSEAELGKVAKCVGCDIRWTTRKSALQKMAHIQACATKNRLTDETVRLLIRREISTAVVDKPATKRKGKEKAPSPGDDPVVVSPQTFLEDIVNEAVAKKKGKRPEIQQTVQSLSETRDEILNRAKAVLGNPAGSAASRPYDDSNDLHPSKGPMPMTQAFGESALGRKAAAPRSHFGAATSRGEIMVAGEEADVQDSMPPSTQAFAPSKFAVTARTAMLTHGHGVLDPPLTQNFGPSKFTMSGGRDFLGAPRQGSPESELIPAPSAAFGVFSESDHDPLRSPPAPPPSANAPASKLLDTEDLDYAVHDQFDDGDNGDAYLHFEPDDNLHPYISPSHDVNDHSSNLSSKDTRDYPPPLFSTPVVVLPKKHPRARRSSSESDALPSALPTKKKSAKGTGKAKAPPEDPQVDDDGNLQVDPDFNALMRDCIMNDEALYSRILRYEPIHYEVFAKIAVDQGLPSRGLKLKLRAFLDKEGINCHSVDPGGSRTRKRHP
ncbi:hypothetical protein PLICRDRAFT_693170 [Plicaturopsis crispa FD-325 SS-3]|nr:hypothetical protein PLICRDRAFT_693170 [Plicaturopsis crispa FD-325 SS-3]